MKLIDEKVKQTYALTDNTGTVKPGDRMVLEGQEEKLR
jgi:hypothetical protein